MPKRAHSIPMLKPCKYELERKIWCLRGCEVFNSSSGNCGSGINPPTAVEGTFKSNLQTRASLNRISPTAVGGTFKSNLQTRASLNRIPPRKSGDISSSPYEQSDTIPQIPPTAVGGCFKFDLRRRRHDTAKSPDGSRGNNPWSSGGWI